MYILRLYGDYRVYIWGLIGLSRISIYNMGLI